MDRAGDPLGLQFSLKVLVTLEFCCCYCCPNTKSRIDILSGVLLFFKKTHQEQFMMHMYSQSQMPALACRKLFQTYFLLSTVPGLLCFFMQQWGGLRPTYSVSLAETVISWMQTPAMWGDEDLWWKSGFIYNYILQGPISTASAQYCNNTFNVGWKKTQYNSI